MKTNNPKYPLYIPTKGRWDSRLTIKTLENMGVDYYAIIEEQEYEEYVKVVDKKHLLILPKEKYHNEYDKLDNLGLTKSPGPGPARNFAWDHSIKNGFKWHWVMDDNIRYFYRLNNNLRTQVNSGAIFRAMEDFCDRYENIAMAGPNYHTFALDRVKYPPFITNTRIYSCNLIRNDVPFRWRGRYNEDTILSLDMLSAGWCTVQFYAFLQGKVVTQSLKGGNTKEFYADEGITNKSEMLFKAYPELTRLVWKFGRPHHSVHYKGFKQKLKRKRGLNIAKGINNYGMKKVTK